MLGGAPEMARQFREPTAVQVHASLDDIEPLIWRRLIVPSHYSLRELHLVLQAAFGGVDAHLHEFSIGGLRYGDKRIAEEWEGGPRLSPQGDTA